MVCGVRVDLAGEGWVDPSPSRPTMPCSGVAKYAALFDMAWTASGTHHLRIGVCEEHAFEARFPKGETEVRSARDLGVIEIRSLPRDVYKANQLRAQFAQLVS